MSARIISLGSVNVDIQLRAGRWPEAGETLLGQDFLMAGGGKAANVAWLARYLGIEAQLIARIGSDSLQEIALHPLRTLGVDLSTIRSIKNQATGVSVIIVQPNGRKGIIMASNANAVWSEEDKELVKYAIQTAPPGSVLSVNLEVPLPIVKQAVRQAEECGMPIVLDPSPSERLDEELLKSGCYLTPNQSEAQQLTKIPIENQDQALEAASKIRQHGNRGVCVKLGTGGCAVVTTDVQLSYPLPRSMRWTPPGRAMRLREPSVWRFWNINPRSKPPHMRLPHQPTLSPAMAPNLPTPPDAKSSLSCGGWS